MLCTMTSIGWTRNSSQTHSGTRNVCIESAQRQVSTRQQPRGIFQANTTLRLPFWNCSLTPQVFCIFIICSPPRPITKPTRDLGTWSYKTKKGRAITCFNMYSTLFRELPLSYQASPVKGLQCILVPGTKQKRTLSNKCKKCLSDAKQSMKYGHEIWNTSAIWAEAFSSFPKPCQW